MSRRVYQIGLPLILLRIGHRVGIRGGLGGYVHRIGMAMSGMVLVLVGWLYTATAAEFHQRADRLAARTPVLTQQTSAGVPAEGGWARWKEGEDTWGERRFSVVFVSPLRPDAPPPPGLPRWPRPGEAFGSPALVHADKGLMSRYGRWGGTIEAKGLSDPGEWLVYLRPISDEAFDQIAERESPVVVGYGVDPSVYSGSDPRRGWWFSGSHQNDRPARDLYVLLVFFVALPAVWLACVCVRVGAERRDRRIAMLRALGASPTAQAIVLIGEAFLPIAAGASLAVMIAMVTTMTDITLPVARYVVPAADLATVRGALIPLWLGVVVVLTVAAALAPLRALKRGGRLVGNRPRNVTTRIGRGAPLLFVVFMGVAVGGAIYRGSVGIAGYLIGVLGALATLPLVAGRIAGGLGTVIAHLGTTRGWPSAIVGGRWLVARPHALARLSAGLVIGVCLATLGQISVTQLSASVSRERISGGRGGQSVVEIRGFWTPHEALRTITALGSDRVLLLTPGSDGVRVTGSCAALTVLGHLPSCPSTPVAFRQAYSSLTSAGVLVRDRSLFATPAMSVVVGEPRPSETHKDGLIFLNSQGKAGVERAKHLIYRNLGMPVISLPGEHALTGAAAWARLADWLIGFALWGLLIIFATGVLAAMALFVTVSRELGPLSAQGAGRGIFFGVAAWNVTVPLTAAVVVSTITAGIVGKLLVHLGRVGRVDCGFLGFITMLAIAASLVVGLLCARFASGRAMEWRPIGD